MILVGRFLTTAVAGKNNCVEDLASSQGLFSKSMSAVSQTQNQFDP